MAAKNIKFEFCIMNLSKKTDWHKDINGGLVPMYEDIEGNTFIESAEIMEKLNEENLTTGLNLWPQDELAIER